MCRTTGCNSLGGLGGGALVVFYFVYLKAAEFYNSEMY